MTAASNAPKTTAAKTAAPRKPRAPKAPADHKQVDPGLKLMTPASRIPRREQKPLVMLARKFAKIAEQTEGLTEDEGFELMFDTIMDVADGLREYAIDKDAYDEYLTGMGAIDRAYNLCVAWLEPAGK